MSIDDVINMAKEAAKNPEVMQSFKDKIQSREKEFATEYKRQLPDDKFYNRYYGI